MRRLSFMLIYSLVAGSVCLQSCSSSVSEQDLVDYMLDPSNGLLRSVKEGDLTMEVIYKPTDLVVAQMVKGENFNEMQIDSVRKSLQSYDYFLVRLARSGVEVSRAFSKDPASYSNAIDYLSIEFGNNVKLINAADTVLVEDFIHTNMLGRTSTDVLVVFKDANLKKHEEFSFLYNDKFFGLGVAEFYFKTNNIKSIPQLDFKTITL